MSFVKRDSRWVSTLNTQVEFFKAMEGRKGHRQVLSTTVKAYSFQQSIEGLNEHKWALLSIITYRRIINSVCLFIYFCYLIKWMTDDRFLVFFSAFLSVEMISTKRNGDIKMKSLATSNARQPHPRAYVSFAAEKPHQIHSYPRQTGNTLRHVPSSKLSLLFPRSLLGEELC